MLLPAVVLLFGAAVRLIAETRFTNLGVLFGALGLVIGVVTLVVLVLLYRRISDLVTQVETVTQQRM